MPRKAAPRTEENASDARVIVPDTSVIVDGRITLRIQRGDLKNVRVVIPVAVLAELEHQANQGHETGFNGLDEIVKIQELKDASAIELEFAGERPLPEDIEHAAGGELDAQIREIAMQEGARLITSDRVQAHVARAMGIDVEWMRPLRHDDAEAETEIEDLRLMTFFDEHTMSVHLKQDVPPYAKRGTPGELKLVKLADKPLARGELTGMSREIIEAAKRDADSFIEIERHGATVVQLRNMRIAIARPPFADGVEITAVRPVRKLTIEDYALAPELKERLKSYQRGVFVSGPPGSGKSTFATAVAEWLSAQDAIVKTMESPRDLQVPDAITQYAPLERSMELTSDVLLLVRPDFVVYDEVRKTDDFKIFGDMRLAGVGLVGVTHANRAIDAVQRLIGRVELGMIPQVVDTVIHIEKGKIRKILEMSFTVKVPAGMKEADLARPVIEVRDFLSKRAEYEIYTYGEQVVVMPLAGMTGGEGASAKDRLAASALRHELKGWVRGRFEVEFRGEDSITLYADEDEIPSLIGKGGSAVQALEREIGLKIDIRPLKDRKGRNPAWAEERRGGKPNRAGRKLAWERKWEDDDGEEDEEESEGEDAAPRAANGGDARYAELTPEVRKSKKNIVLVVNRGLAGQDVEIVIDGEPLFTATVGSKGDVRVQRKTDWGQDLSDALAMGKVVTVRVG